MFLNQNMKKVYHYIKKIEEDDRGEVFADDIEDEVQKSFGYGE